MGSAPEGAGFEERLDPGKPHPLWGEHRARYRLAARFAPGARVLDGACGNGYGAQMLERAGARRVVAIDLSPEAVASGKALRPRDSRVFFMRGDLSRLPFPPASFDLIASFESIEHVSEPGETVREFARVLTREGSLLISSPNGAFYPGGHSGNPFHHIEYTHEQMHDLLAPHFGVVTIYGQRLLRSSPGVLDYGSSSETRYSAPPTGMKRIRRELFGRLPLPLKDVLWRALRGVPYYPGEEEFEFTVEKPETYPIIVAHCRRD
jgi:SAM-dependent methyltransferase